ncbi:nitrosoguanidine resistance protein [Stemphylium lycopersici]|uniref:Nitrosoguanidine resistance protein n=1 Tax=Stemphylium lycopersici TaxID=183478 RepID=A0A364MZM4_STELY|nr:nitrosoguanidine resistance protein [Stemphylium lycopersici]RAQ99711.1 nitrosoguanidine resistance protein [Stemphylium lycopersici]RAR08047.1 nitrosoguanidine resistance protein [Stemphylium lycopersici]
MTAGMQGPYVGTGPSNNDQEPAIEMTRTITGRRRVSGPNASPIEMLKALLPAAAMILAVLWINASHIYGIFHHQGAYTHRAKIALADFDGSDFGSALRSAAALNNGTYGNPTYVNVDTTGSSPEQIRHDVFKGKYWAAIVTQPGATTRFEEAANGTAAEYDSNDVYTYYLLSARYYTLYASNILSPTVTTASTAASIFSAQYIGPRLASGSFSDSTTALSALTNPARAVEAQAGSQDFADLDDKAFINTIGAVLPILMQFFFIMAWNGICNGMHLYAAYDLRTHMLARLFWSTVWPVFTSLCVSAWTFAFRGSYHVDAKMFFALWAVTWVFSMIQFDVLDILTGFVPMAFVPFFFLSWVIFNVAASLGPEEILNHWYRVNYFFPSLHWYRTFITIITQGGVSKLHYTLPVLAAWLVLMKVLSPLATRNRVRKAQAVYKWYDERDAIGGPH